MPVQVRGPVTFVQSPYAGDVDRNVRYARICLRDAIERGEAAFASHLLYPQVLVDTIPEHRELGLAIEQALFDAMPEAQIAVYWDKGISDGMQSFLDRDRGRTVVNRTVWYLGARTFDLKK